MLTYAETLTREPATITETDIGLLRDTGFSDRDILDICSVAAYYAYVNRIADGLGVQLETWRTGVDSRRSTAGARPTHRERHYLPHGC
ncbi:MAG: hypothetical protein BMS9Abin17_1209 [Acidimicrobiia bacterium]|nr:MAG: hypothetical protein BMS9Abin17_1209 [Acidimicrobiia bacterium]